MLTRHEKSKSSQPQKTRSKTADGLNLQQQGGSSGDVVHIACRIPSGLTLRLYHLDDVIARHEAHLAGRPVTALLRPTAEVMLHGAKSDARFDIRDNRLLGMTGYTVVPRDFWEAWVKQNHGCDLLANQLVFAANSSDDAKYQASELANAPTGFEGLEPDKLPVASVTAETSRAGH